MVSEATEDAAVVAEGVGTGVGGFGSWGFIIFLIFILLIFGVGFII